VEGKFFNIMISHVRYNNKLILLTFIDAGKVWHITQFFIAVFCSLYLILSISGESKIG